MSSGRGLEDAVNGPGMTTAISFHFHRVYFSEDTNTASRVRGVLRITGENSTIFITACFQPISIKGVFAERYTPTLNYGHLKHNGIMGL